MRTIEFLKGLPASGKSTYAKEKVRNNQEWVRLNKDDMRAVFHGGKWNRTREQDIIQTENYLLNLFMSANKNIIIDNSHFAEKHLERVKNIVVLHNKQFDNKYKIEINDSFCDVTYAECVARDAARKNPVGSSVIFNMWRTYISPPVERVNTEQLEEVYICDIDGTLSLSFNRGWFDWDKVGQDIVNTPVGTTVKSLMSFHRFIYVTGRDGSCYDITKDWLIRNGFFLEGDSLLYSRAAGDNRKDSVVKKEIYDNHIKGKYHVISVFDDRTQVVDMWRSIGVPCFQVNWGDF